MNQELFFGAILRAVAATLIFIGLPNRNGVSPCFLRFDAAIILYPPVVMIFLAAGVAELVTGLLRIPWGRLALNSRLNRYQKTVVQAPDLR